MSWHVVGPGYASGFGSGEIFRGQANPWRSPSRSSGQFPQIQAELVFGRIYCTLMLDSFRASTQVSRLPFLKSPAVVWRRTLNTRNAGENDWRRSPFGFVVGTVITGPGLWTLFHMWRFSFTRLIYAFLVMHVRKAGPWSWLISFIAELNHTSWVFYGLKSITHTCSTFIVGLLHLKIHVLAPIFHLCHDVGLDCVNFTSMCAGVKAGDTSSVCMNHTYMIFLCAPAGKIPTSSRHLWRDVKQHR